MEESKHTSESQPINPTSRVSFSDIIVVDKKNDRDSLGESNSFTEYHQGKKKKQCNKYKRNFCAILVIIILIIIFILLVASAIRNSPG